MSVFQSFHTGQIDPYTHIMSYSNIFFVFCEHLNAIFLIFVMKLSFATKKDTIYVHFEQKYAHTRGGAFYMLPSKRSAQTIFEALTIKTP